MDICDTIQVVNHLQNLKQQIMDNAKNTLTGEELKINNMNKFEIHIGEIFDLETNSKKPENILIISQEQFDVIEIFAHQRKDAELNTIYKLNECEFRIYPHFQFNKNAIKKATE